MKYLIHIILNCIPIIFFGQNLENLAGSFESNSQLYINDKDIGGFNEDNSFRSNNYLNIDYYLKSFSATIKFESYAPQALLNYSPSLNKPFGVAGVSLKYQTKSLTLTLGNFYDQFGSGLIFRSFEDRQQGIDNSIRGLRIHYQPNNLLFTSFIGKQRIDFNLSEGIIFGVNSEIDLRSVTNKNISFGLSLVGRKQKIPKKTNSNLNEITNMVSGRINYSNNYFYSKIEYVFKSDDALVEFEEIIEDRLFNGNALLINLGYFKNQLGFDASFRRLENMAIYADREAYQNEYNDQIINYSPSLTKQHHFSLSNIYVYQSQPQLTFIPFGKSGEIGAQLDLFYNFKKDSFLGGKYGSQLTINYSQWNRLKATYDLENRTYQSDYIKFGDKNFSDFNIEFNKKWSKKIHSIFTIMHIFYDKEYLEEKVGKINATVIATELKYNFNREKSSRLQLQHLWTNEDKKN